MMMVLAYADLKPHKGIKFSRQHIHKLVKAGLFPAPIKIGKGSNGWIDHEIDEWLQGRMRERDAALKAG